MFLAMLFASIAYNTGAYCNQKHKQSEAVKKGMRDGMCMRAHGKIYWCDGTVTDAPPIKK